VSRLVQWTYRSHRPRTRYGTSWTNAGIAVDVLVNNAGVGLYGELWEQDADELRRMLVLNVEVLTLLTRYALPGMVERGWGRILNLASLVAYQPRGAPNGRLLRLEGLCPVVFEGPGS
jgi:short-subunit dehydrogenase